MKMTVKDAFKLAGLIGQKYVAQSSGSTSINDLIARTLGGELYKEFCKEIKPGVTICGERKRFEEGFIDNPLKEEFWINDKQVHSNYRLELIMDALSKVAT